MGSTQTFTMSHQPFKWGIIGLGRIAHKFARDLDKVQGAVLHAVASRSEIRAREFARQYGAPKFAGTYEELLAMNDLDAVYIATPHHLHADLSVRCLEAGLPVLCEKPLAVNAGQATRMIETARRRGVFLMEALWTRFLPTIDQAIEWIAEGRIGEVHSVTADFGFQPEYDPESRIFNPELAGGALLDIGIYPLFLGQLLFGPPEKILASGLPAPTGVDEELGMLLTYPGNRTAFLQATFRHHTKTEAFIHGSEGTINLHTRWFTPTQMSLHGPQLRPEFTHFEYHDGGFGYQIREVMRCVQEGRTESEKLPWQFSLQLLQTMDTIREQIGLRYPFE